MRNKLLRVATMSRIMGAGRLKFGAKSMFGMTSVVERPRKVRSAVTNNPFFLPGVDMRSTRGRRYRDIVASLIVEFGEADPEALRDLATWKVTLEDTQAAVISGDAAAREDMVRIGNLIARREASLREAASASQSRVPSLAEYLVSKRAEVTQA